MPNTALFGPGYRSAYGLTMIVHHRPAGEASGDEEPVDEGIRVHGSVGYRSILTGTSHGCHRLFNHLAVRLSSFVLAHRRHERRGPIAAFYRREVVHAGRRLVFRIRSRGYRFELTPPIAVDVLEGRVVGDRRGPYHDVFVIPK